MIIEISRLIGFINVIREKSIDDKWITNIFVIEIPLLLFIYFFNKL